MVVDYQSYLVVYSEVLVLMVVENQDIGPLDVADMVAVDMALVDKVVMGMAVDTDVVGKVVVDKVMGMDKGMVEGRSLQVVFLYLLQLFD